MFRLSLAAHALASQGTAVTAAQAKQIFGVAANDGAIFNLTGNTTVTTNNYTCNVNCKYNNRYYGSRLYIKWFSYWFSIS